MQAVSAAGMHNTLHPIFENPIDKDTNIDLLKFYKKYEAPMRRYFERRFDNSYPEKVSDCTSALFEKVFSNNAKYIRNIRAERGEKSIYSYLLQVARSVLCDYTSGNDVILSTEYYVSSDDYSNANWSMGRIFSHGDKDPLDILCIRQSRQIIKNLIKCLPYHQRVIYYDRLFLGMKYEEIAEKYGIATNTVSSRIGKAKNKLLKLFKLPSGNGHLTFEDIVAFILGDMNRTQLHKYFTHLQTCSICRIANAKFVLTISRILHDRRAFRSFISVKILMQHINSLDSSFLMQQDLDAADMFMINIVNEYYRNH